MPANPKRPSPLPTSLSKQSSTTNTTKKIASKPTNPPDNNTSATKSRVPAPGTPSVELTWDTTAKDSVDKAATEPAPVPASSVNRKKQKRRQKQAARQAAEKQFSDGYPSADALKQNGHVHYVHEPREDVAQEHRQHGTLAA